MNNTRPSPFRPWWPVSMLIILALFGLSACAGDPTTSDEYQQLARQLATAEQQLAAMTAERDDLVAQQAAGVELPPAAAEALQRYADAVLAADGNELLKAVTPDFTFISYGDQKTGSEYAAYVSQNYAGFKVEQLGDRLVLGDDAAYIVASPEKATTPAWAEGFSVFRLVQRDGVWLVDQHRWTGQ